MNNNTDDENIPTSEELAYIESENRKALIRSGIRQNVADDLSLLGTTADAAQVLVLFSSADAVAIANAETFEQYKANRMQALASLSGGEEGAANMISHSQALLDGVKNGHIIMPFLVKPEKAAGVFADVAERATGVANVLVSHH